jgi:hypothetical protein
MKKFVYLMVLAFVLISAITPTPQKRIALIVAIGEYPPNGQWRNLSSLNDMRYVKAALVQSGFTANNIDTLVNSNATKNNIVKALDDLYNKVGEGDIVYFQFSGHGQQIQDDNGDEADGYDEALVPYDAAGRFDPVTYNGQNHLRDDLLGEKLNKIRKKIGSKGSLVVLIDACHSGTATRDVAVKRGTEIPFQEPGYKPKTSIDINAHPETSMLEGFTDGMGSMVVFSACSPNQPNYEMKDAEANGVGSLSYAFAKSIADLPAESDYNLLFHKMKALIQGEIASQIPMAEGNMDLEVFGGKYVPKRIIIEVEQRYNNAYNKFNDTTFIINQGLLNGINKGTTLKVHKAGVAGAFCDAVVTQASNFQSICVATKHLKKNEAYEVKIDGTNAGEFAASLFIQNNEASSATANAIATQFTNSLKPFSYLSLSNNPDYTVDISKEANGGYKVSLLQKGDSVKYARTIKDAMTEEDFKYFLAGIKRSMRIKYLRSMMDGGSFGPYIKIEVVTNVKQDSKNEIILKPNETFSLKISNSGPDDYYYTIIDLMPDGEAKVLIPTDDKEASDFVIHGKQSFTIDGIGVDEGTPNGKEMFKLIITKQPMDLRGVLNRTKTRGSGVAMRSVEAMMDDLFQDSKEGTRTRSSINNVKVDEVGIVTCGFTVRN